MKRILPFLLAVACGADQEVPAPLPGGLRTWSYDASMVFPADGSLSRPEDGVALPDGRLIVGDQVHGLRLVALDGSSTPFGNLAASGYVHRPPTHPGGANGVSLEPGGTHLLVTDVFGGGIYRVDVASGATEKIHQHEYGVNAAVRDPTGAIWFTQCAHNPPGDGGAGLWAAIDVPRQQGALFRLPMVDGRPAPAALRMVDSLRFANGVVIDGAAGFLYLAESMAGRVWRFRVDLATGTLSERTVFVDSVGADNLELDGAGNLWIADPVGNEVIAVHTTTGVRHSVFRSRTSAQEANVAEFNRRGQEGKPRMDLMTPTSFAPLPAPVTGVILGSMTGPVYLTGLGNALLKLPR
jgi:sugar lactone lactonase YvrE